MLTDCPVVPRREPQRARLLVPLSQFVLLLVAFCLLRVLLLLKFGPHSVAWIDVLRVFGVGLHLDLFVALLLLLPLLVWVTILPARWYSARWHRMALRVGLFAAWSAFCFGSIAEYYFFEEFKSRFNTVAVDYLLFPHEVFVNIWDAYPVGWVIGICALLGALIVLFQNSLLEKALNERSLRPGWRTVAVGAVSCVLLFLSISINETSFSGERVISEVAKNGQFAFVSAAVTRHLDYGAFYKTIPRSEAFSRARRILGEPGTEFVDSAEGLQRRISGSLDKPRLNVVLLLEESFGSEFWGVLGSQYPGLTPEMDRLARESGVLFTNIYASGNRTVRGLEGVLASFPPLPGDSIVVRPLSRNVETIARVLKRDGYSTVFLYGGRGIFDGMRSFALNNGYDRFIERKHFAAPTFTTVWGVCDEDLYAKSIDECRALAATGRPFFATVLSVSNHKPYTYPCGRIAENPNERKRNNAVKYADYSLGQFFAAARKESFYSNTIFVVVADHGARVYGSQNIPIHSYEIPLLITGPAVVKRPQRISRLGCSLDVAPTILGLLGRPYESLFFGRDLLKRSEHPDLVLMNHNRDIGCFRNDRLVTMGLNRSDEFYRGNPKAEEMHRTRDLDTTDYELERDAIALFQTADDLYMHQQYRVRPVAAAGRPISVP